eukprot:3708700-Rhodomonas_salina.1
MSGGESEELVGAKSVVGKSVRQTMTKHVSDAGGWLGSVACRVRVWGLGLGLEVRGSGFIR